VLVDLSLDLLVFSLMPLLRPDALCLYSLACTVYFMVFVGFCLGILCAVLFLSTYLLRGADRKVFVNVHTVLIPTQEELDSLDFLLLDTLNVPLVYGYDIRYH